MEKEESTMKQIFNIEISVDSEKGLDARDMQEIVEDVINFEGLDWEVTRCEEYTWITEEDIAAMSMAYFDALAKSDEVGHLEAAKPKKTLWQRILDF